jgi:hypothetical protein
MNKKLFCGAAMADITPTDDMMPLPTPMGSCFGGIVDSIYVRAIALGDGESKALLIAFELPGAPAPEKNIPAISKRTGIPEENIMFLSTHAHAAPMIGVPSPIASADRKVDPVLERYESYAYNAMFEAVDKAVSSMRPARVGYAFGESYINVNRNVDYVEIDKDGNRKVTCGIGHNGTAPIDRTLFTMRFEDYDGKPIAFFINYPVHNVVMHANLCFGDKMGISSDMGGNVSKMLEKANDGAVAMWTSGSAGDVNPIMMNQHYFPDPETGKFTAESVPGGDTSTLRTLSTRHYADVLRTLEKIDRYSEYGDLSAAVGWSYTPGRDVIPDPTNMMAEPQVIINDDTKPYDVRLHLIKMGDVALLGISGELYTTLSLHLKAISPMSNTVIVTHDASALSRSGYIYDDDGIARKALHHNRSRILPGYVKESLAKVTLDLFEKLI